MKKGFTLVELVVVVLILGILAAVAAPRMFDLASEARHSAVVQSLAVVRNAIEMHKAAHGELPGEAGTEADLKADLRPFLQRFPENPLKGTSKISVKTDGVAIAGTVSGGAGWIYDSVSGQFAANSNGTSPSGDRYWQL